MFSHLHVHTQYSYLDGFGSESAFVKAAKKKGFTSLGITNHGNIDGVIKFQKACVAEEITPIIGCELYLVEDYGRALKGKAAHATVFVRNKKGWINLCQILHRANTKGFYRTPRIDADYFAKHLKGLIVGSACENSFIMHPYGKKIIKAAKKNLFLEVMPHNSDGEKKKIKRSLFLAKKHGLKLVATNDCHYIKKDDAKTHDILLAIQRKALVSDKTRFRFTIDGLFLRSAKAMTAAYRKQGVLGKKEIKSALKNTQIIVDKCSKFRIEKVIPVLPKVPGLEIDETVYFKKKCSEALKRLFKGEQIPPEYKPRLKEEFDLIKSKGFVRYFLLVYDFLQWCRKNKIPYGPGRGSVGGSLIAYLLKITDVDPIEHDLIFSRFISEDRADFPDIDLDFDKNDRELVKEYLATVFGKDRVVGISTVMRMKSRAVIRDVARTYGLEKEVDSFAKQIDYREVFEEDEPLIEHVAKTTEEGAAFKRSYPEIVKMAIALEGQIRGVGQHPAGVIILPSPLLATKGHGHFSMRKKVFVVNWDKDDAEYMGFVKFDLLSLDTVSVLYKAKELIKKRHGKTINYEMLPLEDEAVLDCYNKSQTTGIFQAGTYATTRLIKDVVVNKFHDLADIFALVRPGPLDSGMTKQYIARKKGAKWEKKHPAYEEITKGTFGIVVYQEQVMSVMNKIAGFTLSEADKIRKIIGKKRDKKEFLPFKRQFIRGCLEKETLGKHEAKEFWEALQKHARYSFNKSHSVAYAKLSYWLMYVRHYYPQEFICALLTKGSKKEERKKEYVEEASRMGYRILPAQIGRADGYEWRIDGNSLIAPFCEVKGLKKKAGEIAALKIKGKGVKGFFSTDETSRFERVPGKLGDVLFEIGAYDGKPTIDLRKYYPFDFDLDPKLTYPNLFCQYGEKIKSEADVKRIVNATRFPKNFMDIGDADYMVYKRVLDCHRCRLRKEAREPVMPSKGTKELMIIGEAPGKEEDQYGIGFIGSSGEFLWKILEGYGFRRGMFHVSNACKCYPGKEIKTPTTKEIEMCLPWLDTEIKSARPKVILAFGNTNLTALLGLKKGIKQYNGKIMWIDQYKAWVCFCLHPSYALRGTENKKEFIKGIKRFVDFILSQNFKK